MKKDSSNVSVTSWLESHPLTVYADLHSLVFRRLVTFNEPDWSVPIIGTTNGVAAFAGELKGNKYVALGFEIFPFEGKKAATTSIVTLNAFKWLSGSSLGGGYVSVYGARSF